MSTEAHRTYNKIEPSYSIKDRIIQIIGFSALLLWLVVYAIKAISFIEYEDDGLFIKAFLFVAAFLFTASIFLGIWTWYKIKRAYSNDPKSAYSDDPSTGVAKSIKWFIIGLFVLMILVPYIFFPESDRFYETYLIAWALAVKHVMRKISKNP